MDMFEFQLRYQAFAGLSRICKLGWEQNICVQCSIISSAGKPDKAIQQISPDELKSLTKETYSNYKHTIIQQNKEFSDSFSKSDYHYPLSDYIERLEYELKVIKEMGFHTYMLVVSDFVMRAKNNSIMVGPGRGSGAGSLLAYLIGITDVNPFAYDLLFERFLNPARVSMPDFDIDFEDTLREKVVHYVTEKYGQDKVCAIGTYMKLATKAAFKDSARAIGIPFDKSNQVSNLLGDISSLKNIVNEDPEIHEELKILYNQDNYIHNAIEQGALLEGNLRQLGVHACGVIISPDPVTSHTPVQRMIKDKKEIFVSQFDGPTLEYIGLLKMDFLGLRNLSVIKNCIKIVKTRETRSESDKIVFEEFLETMSFNPRMDDEKVFETVFAKGDTTGIFQFEGEGIRRFLIDLKPNHINDLVAMGALYRPGPMEFIPSYIHRKHGEEAVEYMIPELIQILKEKYHSEKVIQEEKDKLEEDLSPIMGLTYGIAVYQEQLMFLVQSMAGFSLPEADLLRRGIGKKKKEVIEQLKIEFMKKAETYKNYKPETAKFIYEKMIEPAASYSFNKSHAVCYAHIAYQTGYLKTHYPVEFYAALLRSVEEDTDKLASCIEEVKMHSIPVLQPHVNHSYNHVAAWKGSVIIGFFACKGIGFEIGETIEKERAKSGPFLSLEDFLSRCQNIVNKKSLESLIKAGAFDEWHDRNTLLANSETLLERNKSSQLMDMGLFGGLGETQQISFSSILTTSVIDKCKYDMEIFKTTVAGHPLDGLYLYCKKFGFIDQFKNQEAMPFSVVAMIKKITRAKKKGFFIMVEDMTDSFEFFVKEVLDLKIYDMLVISGYKGRSRSIDTMIKISIEDFILQAQKTQKFDPHWTVARVKEGRRKKVDEVEKTNEEYETHIISEVDEVGRLDEINKISETNRIEEVRQVEEQQDIFSIQLPNTTEKINLLSNILKSYAGEGYSVTVSGKSYMLNNDGFDLIKKEFID